MQEITAKQFQDQKLINQGYNQGAFELTLKFKKILGIEKVAEISDFTREELESERLNR